MNTSLIALLVLVVAFGLFLLVRQRRPYSGGGRGGGMRCPSCGSHDLNYIDSMNRWVCRKCRRMFS